MLWKQKMRINGFPLVSIHWCFPVFIFKFYVAMDYNFYMVKSRWPRGMQSTSLYISQTITQIKEAIYWGFHAPWPVALWPPPNTHCVLCPFLLQHTKRVGMHTVTKKKVEESMPHRKSSPVHILCAISSRQVWPMLNLHSASRLSLHRSTTQRYFWNFQQSTFLTKWKYVTCSPPRLLIAYW